MAEKRRRKHRLDDDSEEKRVLLEKQAQLISAYMVLSNQYHVEKNANPSNSQILD